MYVHVLYINHTDWCFYISPLSVPYVPGSGGDNDRDKEEEHGLLSVPGIPARRADRTPGTAGVSPHTSQSHQGPKL